MIIVWIEPSQIGNDFEGTYGNRSEGRVISSTENKSVRYFTCRHNPALGSTKKY